MVDVQRHAGVARAVRRGHHGPGEQRLQQAVRGRRQPEAEPVHPHRGAQEPQV